MKIQEANGPVERLLALPFIQNIDALYPGIENWFVNTVIAMDNSTVLVARDSTNFVAGVSILKHGYEKKLRCVRIHPSYVNSGLGIRLIDASLEKLECERPLCSVAEEMLHNYSRAFVSRYGFKLTSVEKGVYRRGKLEYLFNQGE